MYTKKQRNKCSTVKSKSSDHYLFNIKITLNNIKLHMVQHIKFREIIDLQHIQFNIHRQREYNKKVTLRVKRFRAN